jgi:phosphomethylpyrimidine synthase
MKFFLSEFEQQQEGRPHMMMTPWVGSVVDTVSKQEQIDRDALVAAIESGTSVILCGKARAAREPSTAIVLGEIARPKICALVGATSADDDPTLNLQALQVAGADCIIDLSTVKNANDYRKTLRRTWQKPLGICVTYDLFSRRRQPYTRESFQSALRAALDCEPDFALAHVGVSRELMQDAAKSKRIMPTTSRGGGLIWAYMERTGADNPFVEYFDILISEMREVGAVLDLGDVFRPGCTADAGDELKEMELHFLAELRRSAMTGGVQVLCESGGHMTFDAIEELIPRYKKILGGAPLWLAGPLPTDRAITLDSIANVIGVALAARHGGNLFASLTNVEHYMMPTAVETSESVRHLRVALDAVDLTQGRAHAVSANRDVSEARRRNDWDRQATHALFPALARNAFLDADLGVPGKPCTICGPLCPHIKTGGTKQARAEQVVQLSRQEAS